MSLNGNEEGEEYYATPKWDNFNAQMQHVLAHTKTQTDAVEATLNGDHTEIDLRYLKKIMDKLEAEFSQYQVQYSSITSEEYVEDDEGLYSDLRGAMDYIDSLVIKINIELEQFQPSPTIVDNSAAATLAAFMKVANSPPVELPTFDGKMISEYAQFKEKFKFIIQYMAGPKELWATHLENQLTGDAKKYIGLNGSWFNKYDELWEVLDDKYANRWNVATEAVSNFFFKPRPEDDQESVLHWFYDQIDNLRDVTNKNMTVEEIGTNLILQMLPAKYAREVRSGLRVTQAGNKKKAAFSIKELREVVNDTIAIKHDPESFSPPISTLNLQTAATSAEEDSDVGTSEWLKPPSQSNGRGRVKTRGGKRRGRSGRGRGRVNKTKSLKCYLYNENTHWAAYCKCYQSALEKRNRLIELNRCTACGNKHTNGEQCNEEVECTNDDHRGQRHYSWLCGGKAYPGIQPGQPPQLAQPTVNYDGKEVYLNIKDLHFNEVTTPKNEVIKIINNRANSSTDTAVSQILAWPLLYQDMCTRVFVLPW